MGETLSVPWSDPPTTVRTTSPICRTGNDLYKEGGRDGSSLLERTGKSVTKNLNYLFLLGPVNFYDCNSEEKSECLCLIEPLPRTL